MRVFLTGATGFIGTALVSELVGAGHQVLGLTRSDAGAAALEAAGAEPYRGTLEDPESMTRGAARADAVIHTAFDHDFSNFVANCEKDRRAIEALAAGLARSNGLLVITSGTGMGSAGHGRPADEDIVDMEHPNPRKASEQTGQAVAAEGARVAVVRLPQVHDTRKQGLITPYLARARETGLVAYVGDGLNRWPAVHLDDAARLYRLALEKQAANVRYHAVAEEGLPVRNIAAVLGRGLGVPVRSISKAEAPEQLGWLAPFVAMDLHASGAKTQERLDWHPIGPGLIADLEAMSYAA